MRSLRHSRTVPRPIHSRGPRPRYLPADDVQVFLLRAIREFEQRTQVFTRAARDGGGYEGELHVAIAAHAENLGIAAGASIREPGVRITHNRAFRLPGRTACRNRLDFTIRGINPAQNHPLEIKALRRSRGQSEEVARLLSDVRKVEEHVGLPGVGRGFVLCTALGLEAEEFEEWISAAAGGHDRVCDDVPLGHGRVLLIALIHIYPRAVPLRRVPRACEQTKPVRPKARFGRRRTKREG